MTNWKKIIQGIFLSFVFVFASVFLVLGMQWFSENLKNMVSPISPEENTFLGSIAENPASNIEKISETNVPYRTLRIKNPEILAGSAVAVETNLSNLPDGVLFKQEGGKKLSIASLTKLITAVVALDVYQPMDNITISKNASMQTGKQGSLAEGDKMSVKDLLYIMLIDSSNQAAYALSEGKSEEKFVAMMNQKAREIGLFDTYLADPTGLSSENSSTAEDLVKLTEHLLENYPIITEISRTKEFDLYRSDGTFYGKLNNTNELLGEIPEIIGGKTGFTTDAKGCLLLVLNNPVNNDYLIYVILGADDRFTEMKKLIDWVNTAYRW